MRRRSRHVQCPLWSASQEGPGRQADSAGAKLKAMISVTATAIRDGRPQEVAVSQLVPGDILELAAGDMIPADVRMVAAKDQCHSELGRDGRALHRQDRHADDGSRHPGEALRRRAEGRRWRPRAGVHEQSLPDRVEERPGPRGARAYRHPPSRKDPRMRKGGREPVHFQRRIMSVVVRTPEGRDRIVSKGAPEAIFPCCANFELAQSVKMWLLRRRWI